MFVKNLFWLNFVHVKSLYLITKNCDAKKKCK